MVTLSVSCVIQELIYVFLSAFVTSPVPYRELYSNTLYMVGELAMNHTSEAHALCERVAGLLATVPQCLAEPEGAPDAAWGLRDRLEALSNYLEVTNTTR